MTAAMPYLSGKSLMLHAWPLLVAAMGGLIEFVALARSRWRCRRERRA